MLFRSRELFIRNSHNAGQACSGITDSLIHCESALELSLVLHSGDNNKIPQFPGADPRVTNKSVK